MSRSREAYRAVYLASPLKFCTSLHAFTRIRPRFHIGPWQKDPHAWHKHQWRSAKRRKKGSFYYPEGPLVPLPEASLPDPGLVGADALAQLAATAQEQGVQTQPFWHKVAERTRQLRDIMSVSQLATVLDALLTAEHRHTDLMKTLARELIDDIDKLSLTEVAVVANAYAHFNCVSKGLLTAVTKQIVQLLEGQDLTAVEPRSLAVLVRALARLDCNDEAALSAINSATVMCADRLSFAELSEILAAFCDLDRKFVADTKFWEAAAAKVPGSRMASLCPALRAASRIRGPATTLCDALVTAATGELRLSHSLQVPSEGTRSSLGLLSSSSEGGSRLPAFVPPLIPEQLLTSTPSPAGTGGGVGGNSFRQDVEADPNSLAEEMRSPANAIVDWDHEVIEEEDQQSSQAGAGQKIRLYNPVSRRLFSSDAGAGYAPFDPSKTLARNRRGVLVSDAVDALHELIQQGWKLPEVQQGKSGSSAPQGSGNTGDGNATSTNSSFHRPNIEAEFLELAAPVLCSSLQGLSPVQLARCAEVYATNHMNGAATPGATDASVVHDIVKESVRRLSNFSVDDLRRLHAAAQSTGVQDGCFERARYRRFPKALRNELRDQLLATGGAPQVL